MKLNPNAIESANAASCDSRDCGCGPMPATLSRRNFVGLTGASLTLLALDPALAVAGPFQSSDFAQLIPPDKKLKPEWVKSLYARGAPQFWRGKELELVGLPIGGVCTGMLYLGGDGKLWLWDIFNRNPEGVQPKTLEYAGQKIRPRDGSTYVEPLNPVSPFEQGFALRLKGDATLHHLDHRGFKDISFRGEYPIGQVEYRDAALPLAVSLEAFSPFIPLDAEASSLPVTVMRFNVRNTGNKAVDVELIGWMENAVGLYSKTGTKQTEDVRNTHLVGIEHSVMGADETLPDFGTLSLTLTEPQSSDHVEAADAEFKNCGSVARKLMLKVGEQKSVTFLVAWRFPNQKLKTVTDTGNYYATRFASASAAAEHVAANFNSLHEQTRRWRDTWYDSTLPYWFLDRTFINTSILATTTAHRVGNGRFYAWEGIGCCEGTCTHVWHYAQAMGRIFPELERNLRERTDFGLAFNAETGLINYRGERGKLAVDGQAGIILRSYREHQMSKDDGFLRAYWPKIKKALQHLIAIDDDNDGVIEAAQPNTLDAAWYGKLAWISSLYHAALRAGEEMAKEMNDADFVRQCRELFERGVKALDAATWDERKQYYVQVPDPKHLQRVGSYDGCHIDQVMGQSWAFQVGLGRVMDEKHCRAALRSLWKYSFTPDVGPFRAKQKAGRWYAMPGEGGLIMVTYPFGKERQFTGKDDAWTAGYFNECMSGFEYQVAGHMIHEGMIEEGLAITRAIHDRYHARLRNPYNEVECSDHYARAMASYGVYLAACGFEYHGPQGHLGFAPKLTPDDFRAPFTAAEGWGSFAQKRAGNRLSATVTLRWGQLRLRSLALALPEKAQAKKVRVKAGTQTVETKLSQEGRRLLLTFAGDLRLKEGERLTVEVA